MLLGDAGVIFGSSAIAIHAHLARVDVDYRTPGDLDVYGNAAVIASRLRSAGFVRIAPREFLRPGQCELPVQLWDSQRPERPAGVPPCLAHPQFVYVDGVPVSVASLTDLRVMKTTTVRRRQRKMAHDQYDLAILDELHKLAAGV